MSIGRIRQGREVRLGGLPIVPGCHCPRCIEAEAHKAFLRRGLAWLGVVVAGLLSLAMWLQP